jgi:phosphoglycerate dehydrogenase-like enzyme
MSFKIAMGDSENFRPYLEYLRSTGLDVHPIPTRNSSPEETIKNFKGFDGAVAGGEKFTQEVCAALADSLKIICRFGLGYEMVEVKAAEKLGICVTNTAGTMSAGVAECAFLLMLEVRRRFAKFDADIQNHIWDRSFRGTELEGSTIGIVGFGAIGQRFAQYCSGFKCRMLAYDIHFNSEMGKQLGVASVSLDELAKQSDVVSLHCPMMPETEKIISRDFIGKMKKTSYLVNSARGGLVDQPSLIEALKEGRIAGAGLDVFMHEPLEAESELRGMKNVVLTPHIASRTFESLQATAEDVSDSFHTFIKNGVPKHCLNPGYTKNRLDRRNSNDEGK